MFLRNRLKYALTGDEVKRIVKQRLIKVDGKVRTDPTYPAGFMGECVCLCEFCLWEFSAAVIELKLTKECIDEFIIFSSD